MGGGGGGGRVEGRLIYIYLYPKWWRGIAVQEPSVKVVFGKLEREDRKRVS